MSGGLIIRRQRTGAVWGGLASSRAAAAAGVAGSQPGGLVRRRGAARAVIAGLAVAPIIAHAVTGGTVSRRTPAQRPRAVVAHVTGVAFPNGSRPGGQGVYRRRPARGVTGHVYGQPPAGPPPAGQLQPHPVVARRAPARAVALGTVVRTVNAAPSAPVNGTLQPHLTVARRYPARAVTGHITAGPRFPVPVTGGRVTRRSPARGQWAGTAVRAANAAPLRGSIQPHPLIARRAAARAYTRWIPVTTTNAPPPAFQVARSVTVVTDPDTSTATVTALATSTAAVTDPRDGTPGVT